MWWERHNLPSTISCVTFYPGGRGVTSIWWPLTEVITIQLTINIYRRTRARIHTFFHHFTEIGQIFHIKHIFKINKLSMMKSRDEIIGRFARRYPRKMELANILSGMIQKPRKFPGAACPRTPPRTLRRSFRKSVCIYPRSAPGTLVRMVKRWPWLHNRSFVYLGTFITGHLREGGLLIGGHILEGQL